MNLLGQTCLITGASTGLGLAASKRFAAAGANTILMCRDRERGKIALRDIRTQSPNASAELMICDLASVQSIRAFLAKFTDKFSKLDILYNNAAVMKKKRTITLDGLETMFQVNYLAHWFLVKSLLGLLKNGSSPRIINNGRPSYKLRLDVDDLQSSKSYGMYSSFFKTKLCLLFATLEYSRRLEKDGVAVTMIDPGTFKSDLVREVPLMGWIKNLASPSVDKAAENILLVATMEATETTGRVFKEKEEWPLSDYWRDRKVAEQVWSLTESLIQRWETP